MRLDCRDSSKVAEEQYSVSGLILGALQRQDILLRNRSRGVHSLLFKPFSKASLAQTASSGDPFRFLATVSTGIRFPCNRYTTMDTPTELTT